MTAITEHARSIAESLSASLAELESVSPALSVDTARRAIRQTWLTVVDDVERGRADVSSRYLADVHRRLMSAAGLTPEDFRERGLPILPSGGQESWTRFVNEAGYGKDDDFEEVYALSQMRWGQHVGPFALTLGWFAMNILLLTRGKHAIYAPVADHNKLVEYLSWAGPDAWDGESLRRLIGTYIEVQSARPGRPGTA